MRRRALRCVAQGTSPWCANRAAVALCLASVSLSLLGCGGWAETCGIPSLSERAVSIVVSEAQSCARTAGGEVTCWGECARLSREPTTTRMEHDDVLWAGGSTVCVASRAGLRCWGGRDFEPVLGVASRPVWVGISGRHGVMIVDQVALTFPSAHDVRDDVPLPLAVHERWPLPADTIGLVHDVGRVRAVRRDGTVVARSGEPVAQLPITDLVSATGSVDYGCVVDERAVVACWGRAREPHAWPRTEVVPITDVVEVLAAGLEGPEPDTIPFGAHACARRSNGEVWCWGDDGCDAQPIRVPGPSNACDRHRAEHPERVPLPGPATDLAVAPHHACALIEDGSVYCWGSNFWGALGDGTRIDSSVPVRALVLGIVQ